jgi:hypothetical protein
MVYTTKSEKECTRKVFNVSLDSAYRILHSYRRVCTFCSRLGSYSLGRHRRRKKIPQEGIMSDTEKCGVSWCDVYDMTPWKAQCSYEGTGKCGAEAEYIVREYLENHE